MNLQASKKKIDASCLFTYAMSPMTVNDNGPAMCERCITSTRRIQKISIPKHDGHTYKMICETGLVVSH